jgi:hypothetical protein
MGARRASQPGRVSVTRSTSPRQSRALPWTVAWQPDLSTLLRQATPTTRARLMLDLQRTVGNAAARRLLTEPPRSSPTVHGGGPSVSLRGDTTAEYDGGVSKWTPKSMKRAKACTECPEDDPCLHAVGTFTVTYGAKVTIGMPDVPDGLTECQQRRKMFRVATTTFTVRSTAAAIAGHSGGIASPAPVRTDSESYESITDQRRRYSVTGHRRACSTA